VNPTQNGQKFKAVILMVTQNPEFIEKSEKTESVTKLAIHYRIGRKTHMKKQTNKQKNK
jgi:hypothetical protein